MKLACQSAALFLVLTLSAPAWADSDTDLDFLKDRPVGGDPVGPDPDATPKAFEHKSELSPAERAIVRENLKAAQANKDWLLHAYEQQLHDRPAKTTDGDTSSNLFSELNANKDLAKIAGIDNSEFTMPEVIDFHTGTDATKHADANLRPDPGVQTATSSAQLAPRGSFYSSTSFLDVTRAAAPFAAPSPLASTELAPLSLTAAAETTDSDAPLTSRYRPTDPGAMDIPGMTAEEANPSAGSPSLSSADLPGGTTRINSTSPGLSLDTTSTTNLERLEKIRQTQLLAPGQTLKKPTPVVSAVKIPAPSDTEQMVPDPGTQRAHVDDPFDILR